MANRRYSIDLVVSQQTTPPPPPPPPPNPNTPPPPGSPVALDQMAKYITSIYALKQAWGVAKTAIDSYVESQEKLNEAQKTATERMLDFERRKRAYMFAAGGLDPAKRAAAGQDLDAFAARHPFQSPAHALTFAERWESDVAQYSKGDKALIDPKSERELRDWVADFSIKHGIPEEQANQGAAAILGSTRWSSKFKDKAAANVKTKFARAALILAGGKGDPKTNWKTFAKLMNFEMNPDESQSRIRGEEAIEDVAEEARIGAEFDPQQAETFMRNRDLFLRQFGKPAVKKGLKAAGIDYTLQPHQAYTKIAERYLRLKESGKLPEGMTLNDYIQNIMKGNIRAAIGMQATTGALAAGATQNDRAEARKITPGNVDQVTAAAGADAAAIVDKAAAASAAEQRRAGAEGVATTAVSGAAGELFQARGYGYRNDPRGWIEKGGLRWLNPANLWGGKWKDWDEDKLVGDAADLMAFQAMVKKNMPGVSRRMAPGGMMTETPWWQEKGDEFYRSDANTRAQMMDEQIRLMGGRDKALEYLAELVRIAKEGRDGKAGVPLVPQVPGMVGGP